MFSYTTYFLSTGQITGLITSSVANAVTVGDSAQGQISGAYNSASMYVLSTSGTPTATARPAMGITVDTTAISANGTACSTFSNVPAGCAVAIDGGTPQACPTPMQFAATDAGTYVLDFSCFPYLDQTFSVVAS